MSKCKGQTIVECKICNEIYFISPMRILENGEVYQDLRCPYCEEFGSLNGESMIYFTTEI